MRSCNVWLTPIRSASLFWVSHPSDCKLKTLIILWPASVNQEVLDTAGTHPVQYQLAFAIHMAITQMWSNNYASIRLDAYRNAIIRYADTFGQSHAAQLLRTNGQQDTHELIVFLMDLLHECYKRPCVVPYEKQREDSIIKDQFRFFSVTEFVCGTENCGNVLII